ncbi:uncharacterized protein EV420DRAFT_1572728, partial [Desarmillaria tabescens]
MLFYVCLFLISLANILVPMWTDAIAPLSCFQRILHSILSSRVMLLILKQRRIRRRCPTEELYMDDVELVLALVPPSKTIKDANAVEKRSRGSGYLYAFSPSLYQIIMPPMLLCIIPSPCITYGT